MKQTDLDRAVARATGESVHQIRKLGFQLVPVARQSAHRLQGQSAAPRAEVPAAADTPRSR